MRGGRSRVLVCLVLLFVLSLGVRLYHYHRGWQRYQVLFFYHGRPLLVGFDAYYYLRLTRDYLTGHYQRVDELRAVGQRPQPPPLLVCLTAWLHKLTKVHYEWLAFFLPPVLGSLLVIPLFEWGRVFGGFWCGMLAALLGATNYYWSVRSALGRFDTDSLLPFLVFLLPYGFLLGSRGRVRWAWLLVVSLSLLFLWWWPQGRASLPFLLLSGYVGTFFLVSHTKRRLRLFLAICPLFLLPFVWRPELWPLTFGRDFFLTLHHHLLLLLGREPGPVGVQISELKPLDRAFVFKFIGPPVLLCAAGAGAFLLIWKRGREVFCLLGPLVLALFSLVARRFAIYLVPFYALTLAFFLVWLGRRGRRAKVLAMVLAGVVLGLNGQKTVQKTVSPLVNKWHAALAETLAQQTPPETLVWCWWDYGYFVQYYAKRRTFADGGLQHPWRLVTLSFPFVTKDPLLAANWMEFFAFHGPETLWSWHKKHPGPEGFRRLCETIRAKKPLSTLLVWRKKPTPLALFLPFQMFSHTSWTRFGHWLQGEEKSWESRFLKRFSFDPEGGRVTFDEETRLLKEVFFLYFSPWPKVQNHLLYPHPEGRVMIRLLQVPFAFLFDAETARGLAVRLLFFAPQRTEGFELLDYQPLQGGVWRLKPLAPSPRPRVK